jgi:hypothetical protein
LSASASIDAGARLHATVAAVGRIARGLPILVLGLWGQAAGVVLALAWAAVGFRAEWAAAGALLSGLALVALGVAVVLSGVFARLRGEEGMAAIPLRRQREIHRSRRIAFVALLALTLALPLFLVTFAAAQAGASDVVGGLCIGSIIAVRAIAPHAAALSAAMLWPSCADRLARLARSCMIASGVALACGLAAAILLGLFIADLAGIREGTMLIVAAAAILAESVAGVFQWRFSRALDRLIGGAWKQ